MIALPEYPQLHFQLFATGYREWRDVSAGPVALASCTRKPPFPLQGKFSWELDPGSWHVESGSAADWHRLTVANAEELPQAGWVRCQVAYQFGYQWGSPLLPLAFYIGEPTDFPTGIARFAVPLGESPEGPQHYQQGPVVILTVRRSE